MTSPRGRRAWRYRFAAQLLVVGGFIAVFTAGGKIADALLLPLPRGQVGPAVIRALFTGGIGVILFLFLLVLFTLIFGRFYCGALCPLGMYQDGVRWVTSRIKNVRFSYRGPRRVLRYVVLAATVISVGSGTLLVLNLIEPYALFGRILRDFLVPAVGLVSHVLHPLLKAIGVYTAPFTPSYTAATFAAGVVALLLLTWAGARYGRGFCNTFCPTGALLSLLSRRSLFRISVDSNLCTSCGVCEGVCKAGCLSAKYKRSDPASCVLCLSCVGSCRFGALFYAWRGGGKGKRTAAPDHREETPSPGLSRRNFLTAAGAAALGAVGVLSVPRKTLLSETRFRAVAPDGSRNTPAAPPGAESIARFTSRCVSCHLCVSRCPTSVLQPSLLEYGPGGILQPTMDYARGFCEYECHVCGTVCPTGAILPLPLELKKRTQIGTAVLLESRCVVFTRGTACGACAEVCPTGAVHMIPYRGYVTRPVTDDSICIGCGNCEYACPVPDGKAIYVRGGKTHSVKEMPEAIDVPAGSEKRPEKAPAPPSDGGENGFAF